MMSQRDALRAELAEARRESIERDELVSKVAAARDRFAGYASQQCERKQAAVRAAKSWKAATLTIDELLTEARRERDAARGRAKIVEQQVIEAWRDRDRRDRRRQAAVYAAQMWKLRVVGCRVNKGLALYCQRKAEVSLASAEGRAAGLEWLLNEADADYDPATSADVHAQWLRAERAEKRADRAEAERDDMKRRLCAEMALRLQGGAVPHATPHSVAHGQFGLVEADRLFPRQAQEGGE